MKRLEHWAHRLYPKLPFDDVLKALENLGKKQAVKTNIKKIRMDLGVGDQDQEEEVVDDQGLVVERMEEEEQDSTKRYGIVEYWQAKSR